MYDLERCPCTIHFAVSDVGRWAPDPECNMDRPTDDPLNCKFHKAATHCVLNIRPTCLIYIFFKIILFNIIYIFI